MEFINRPSSFAVEVLEEFRICFGMTTSTETRYVLQRSELNVKNYQYIFIVNGLEVKILEPNTGMEWIYKLEVARREWCSLVTLGYAKKND